MTLAILNITLKMVKTCHQGEVCSLKVNWTTLWNIYSPSQNVNPSDAALKSFVCRHGLKINKRECTETALTCAETDRSLQNYQPRTIKEITSVFRNNIRYFKKGLGG